VDLTKRIIACKNGDLFSEKKEKKTFERTLNITGWFLYFDRNGRTIRDVAIFQGAVQSRGRLAVQQMAGECLWSISKYVYFK
jgi:hypothetical protein